VIFGNGSDRRTREDARMPRDPSARSRVLIVSWGSGGNLPPLLAAGELLAAGDHAVSLLASAATRAAGLRAGFEVIGYRRAGDPNLEVAFEQEAAGLMATAAGAEVALDVCDVAAEVQPDLMIVDCMLPAGIAAGEASGTPTASLVHFPYGLARAQMLRGAGAWTTDFAQLNRTRRRLGLKAAADALAAWESAELLLVTVPRWFDLAADYPGNIVHAGPLGVTRPTHFESRPRGRPLVLLSFSTTVMEGQMLLIQRVCDAIAGEELDAVLTLGPAVSAGAIRVPHNVEAVPYADHDQLLPRCAAVVTHGGLGTTLRALAHGTPLLLLPLGRDQQFNASRVVELDAGSQLPLDAAPVEIASALAELLAQPQFTEAAERAAAAIAADAPDETATEALLSLAQLTN
jgi:UDP:flavonoid glycosyltransferase YjiC (YdhE family)